MNFKNFKTLFSLGVIAMTLVVLSSCSEDEPEPTLIGTWLYESFDAGKHTAALEADTAFINAHKGQQWAFESNGAFIFTDTDGSEERATWMLENDTLTFTHEDEEDFSIEVRELSATTLKLHRPEGWSLGDFPDIVNIPVTFAYKKQ